MYLLPFHQQAVDVWGRSMILSMEAMRRMSEIAQQSLSNPATAWPSLAGIMALQVNQMREALENLRYLSETAPEQSPRVALVTGGIGGIGTAICKRLALKGNRVIALYAPVEAAFAEQWRKECEKEGFDFATAECDVRDFDACHSTVQRLEAEIGPIDILVNCAGITRDNTLRKMDESSWHDVLDTNLDSVFNMSRSVVEGMLNRGFGRIINISSVNGQKGQFGQTNYSASKAGVVGFTRSLAKELAPRGITVNAVSPGYVATRMVMNVPEEIREQIIAKIPVGRLGEPEEVARVVSFLADDSSGYITGEDLSVNGGLFMS